MTTKNDKNKFNIINTSILNVLGVEDSNYLFSRHEFKLKILEYINYHNTKKILINEEIITNMNIQDMIVKNEFKLDEIMSYNKFEKFVNMLIENFSK